MIVCHCNVLSKADILSTLAEGSVAIPRSAAQVHKCLGCAPQCGRCLPTVRDILAEAKITAIAAGCAVCPANAARAANDGPPSPPFLMAAE
jgi:bacterioferritin-associated ferredoxin